MAKICPRCSCTNPADAGYCYFDGTCLPGNLQSGPVQAGTLAFAHPFVFPSGEACRNFNQFVTSCQNNWGQARDFFQQGILEKFLQGMGRLDLAENARQAAQSIDPDRGLDQLLGTLPADVLEPAKLQVEPTQMNLGQVRAGAESDFDLIISNQGTRLLVGSVTAECDWLMLGDAPGQKQKLFQVRSDVKVSVRLKGQKIRAGAKPYVGRLIVDSNGGRQSVKVYMDVPILPFSEGILEGARTPRELAQKARQSPKEAGVLFEKGAVVEWYQNNGWIYPVEGPTSSGLGAVQQYFEALGLAKAPRVEISHTQLQFQGSPGEKIPFTLNVWTQDRKPVFAHATSDLYWVTFPPPRFQGAEVRLPLEMEIPHQPGDVVKGKITVIANGNQRFQVPLEVVIDSEASNRRKSDSSLRTPAGSSTAVEEFEIVLLEENNPTKRVRNTPMPLPDEPPSRGRKATMPPEDDHPGRSGKTPMPLEIEDSPRKKDEGGRMKDDRAGADSIFADEATGSEDFGDSEDKEAIIRSPYGSQRLPGRKDSGKKSERESSEVGTFGMGRLVYWSALIGGWSAFAGWLIAELAVGRWIHNLPLAVFMVMLVASALGAGLSQVEGLLTGQWKSQIAHLGPGLLGGFSGGLLGGIVSNLLLYIQPSGSSEILRFVLTIIGWTLLGAAIGISEGVYELHWRKVRNGLIGGGLGGFLGGLAFFVARYVDSQITGRAIAFVLLGLFIGLSLSLVQVLLKEAWITVEEGFRPGRQLILSQALTTMGTSEKASLIFIAYGAKGVEPIHLLIRQKKNGEFVLEDNESRGGTLLNDEKIDGPMALEDGDLIQFGVNKVRFHERMKRVARR